MRLNQFEFLMALEEYKSFSKAAQVLFISQPSLSAAVKELENELGFTILMRSKKGVSFTPQGEIVLKEAKIIMAAVQRIEHIEYQEDGNLVGKLRVGGIPYFCDMLLVHTLMDLQQSYPGLTVQLIEDDTDYILKLVAEEQLDLGLILVSYINESDKRNELSKIKVNYHKLFDDKMVFVAREGHPLLQDGVSTIGQILKYPFVTHRKSANPVTEKLLQEYCAPHKMLHISGLNNLRQYLLQSDAISVFPSKVIQEIFITNEKLRIIKTKDFLWPCEVGWVSKKDLPDLSVEIFIKTLMKQSELFAKSSL